MFPCLKEDGDGPGGALCPLEWVLESALVKDSFCSRSPASHIFFPAGDSMCSHLQKATLLYLLLAVKGLSESIQKEGKDILSSLPPHYTWPECCLCCSYHKCILFSACGLLCSQHLGDAYEFSSWVTSEVTRIKSHHQLH